MSVYKRVLARDPITKKPLRIDSKWSVRLEVQGRTIRKTVGSHADAVAWEKDQVSKAQKGLLGRRSTLAAYVAKHWPIGEVSESTAAREKYTLDGALLPRFGRTELSRISVASVKDFRRELRQQQYSPATVNDFMRLLRKILINARDRGILGALPAWPEALKEPRLKQELSENEQVAFLAAFNDRAGFLESVRAGRKKVAPIKSAGGVGRRHDSQAALSDYARFSASQPLFVIAIETGLALSDLLALKWSAVDLEAGVVRGRRRKTNEDYSIPVSKKCREALGNCARRDVAGHVLLTAAGRPYSVMTVGRYFRKAKKLAGITRALRFHDLRHTFGSTLASRGVSRDMIGMMMGHAPGSPMTARYAKPGEAEALAAGRAALDARS